MYMYNWITLVYLKLTHCKPTTLQCKIKVRRKKKKKHCDTKQLLNAWMMLPLEILPKSQVSMTSPWKWVLVALLCLTFYDTVTCSPPGCSVHRILHARILEWIAISFSRRTSRPRDWTQSSCIVGRLFTVWATREAWHHLSTVVFYTSSYTWIFVISIT